MPEIFKCQLCDYIGDRRHLNTIMSHLHDKHGITRHGTPELFTEYLLAFGVPKCACGCGSSTSLHCRKLQYNLFADGCKNSSRFKNPSCPEFYLFNGKSVDETIDCIRAIQSKPISEKRKLSLSTANSGNNNPMSVEAISKRTGLSLSNIKIMLSEKSRGAMNGFYKRKHRPETLAKLAESRSRQCKQVTVPEMAIWGILAGLDVEFEYQVAIDRYVVDFLLPGSIVVEVYGDYWHDKKLKSSNRKKKDDIKIKKLKQLGYAVLVIWESEIFLSTATVVADLKKYAN